MSMYRFASLGALVLVLSASGDVLAQPNGVPRTRPSASPRPDVPPRQRQIERSRTGAETEMILRFIARRNGLSQDLKAQELIPAIITEIIDIDIERDRLREEARLRRNGPRPSPSPSVRPTPAPSVRPSPAPSVRPSPAPSARPPAKQGINRGAVPGIDPIPVKIPPSAQPIPQDIRFGRRGGQ